VGAGNNCVATSRPHATPWHFRCTVFAGVFARLRRSRSTDPRWTSGALRTALGALVLAVGALAVVATVELGYYTWRASGARAFTSVSSSRQVCEESGRRWVPLVSICAAD
jgi:hypothetical protein